MCTTNSDSGKHSSQPERMAEQSILFLLPSVADFCQGLSPDNCQAVTEAVDVIARLRKKMVVNMLAIGDDLIKLREAIGSEHFSRFMTDLLPTLGISRSTGYRWMGFADQLAQVFPDPTVRRHLMMLTDGRGIVSNSGKENKNGCAKVVLTRAAEAALKTLPPLPAASQTAQESEQWVRQFVHATARARALDRTPGRSFDHDQRMIIRKFNRFARHYGPSAAEDLCGQLDKMLNYIVENCESPRGRLYQS